MNIKNYWMMLAIALVSICAVSCGRDNDDDMLQKDDNNGNTTEVITDYLATTSVKNLKMISNTINSPYTSSGDGETYKYYQDYNHYYVIYLSYGEISIIHYVRKGGNWSGTNDNVPLDECGIIDTGEVTAISDILSKNVYGGENVKKTNVRPSLRWYSAEFQPRHGYVVMFTTEAGEKKYMRVFAKDYSLDNNGVLKSVTIQYQLF